MSPYVSPPDPVGVKPQAAEQTQATVPDGSAPTGQRETVALVTPTQVRRPWRATVRTGFQALVALLTLLPLVATDVYQSPDAYPAVIVQVLLVSAAASRVMANPAVENFLRQFVPFLSAAPKEPNA